MLITFDIVNYIRQNRVHVVYIIVLLSLTFQLKNKKNRQNILKQIALLNQAPNLFM